ncbi:MAG: hypothetical protein NDJ24_03010 [Alphaproteobacteria bacterium]|nr:hypothetical protein [Alphaproteobacteria bacterium]
MDYSEQFKQALLRVYPDQPIMHQLAAANNAGQLGFMLRHEAEKTITPDDILSALASGDLDTLAARARHLRDSRTLYHEWKHYCPPELCPPRHY